MHVNNPSYITKSFENIYLCKKHGVTAKNIYSNALANATRRLIG